jgi:uncharacterized protein
MSQSALLTFYLPKSHARGLWLRAQRLDEAAPFGGGPEATRRAVEHLGYVQIDTINVIERCHHHILFTRIPGYARAHLLHAQSHEKSVFEYWTHALAYVPTRDLRFFLGDMKQRKIAPFRWHETVKPEELRKVLSLIKRQGAVSIRDIDDDELVDKDHPWASRKPSKKALQLAFYAGDVTISARTGMLKSYELTARHFGWQARPKAATERQVAEYLVDRALRSQGFVSLDSICYLNARQKASVRAVIDARVRAKRLVAVVLEGAERIEHWATPEALAERAAPAVAPVHILSPFDPLIIQRKRVVQVFDYEHRFEAYVPKAKRVLGYFALPVLVGDEIVAALDLKTDRAGRKLLVQQWTWVGHGAARRHKRLIEEALHRFEQFQLG